MASVTDTNASDSSASLTAIIDWGDGSPTSFGVVSGGAGAFVVTGTHTYQTSAPGATSSLTVTLTAPSGAKVAATYAATVRSAATAITTEFTIPTSGAGAQSIVAGSDNGMWFTEQLGGKVGRVATMGAPTGSMQEYKVSGSPYGMTSAVGPGALLWFTESNTPGGSGTAIGSMNTAGFLSETYTPTYDEPFAIAGDLSGSVWFTEADGSAIGKINTASLNITEVSLPMPGGAFTTTFGIAVADSGVWFAEGSGTLGLLTPSTMAIKEFPGHSAGGGIAVGPDSNVWFLEDGSSKIGYINPSTQNITDLTIVTPTNGTQSAIVTGPDGNLWYTPGDSVARITPTGAVTEFPTPT